MNNLCAAAMLVLCSISTALHAQQPAASTQTPSRPWSIRQTWNIGGAGPWDYLTMDPASQRLYVAHGRAVQVVDVTTGTLVGKVTGLSEAHEVALDDTGEFGYVSDGIGSRIVVFDRRTLGTVATIEDVPSPRCLVFEPQTKLLFAVRTDQAPAPRQAAAPRTTAHIPAHTASVPQPATSPAASSSITVIDTQSRQIVAEILLPGTLGFALADNRSNLFISSPDRNRMFVVDAQTVAGLLPKHPEPQPEAPEQAKSEAPPQTPTAAPARASNTPARATSASAPAKEKPAPFAIDWTGRDRRIRSISFDGNCITPKSLAIDSAHQRLFVACENRKLFVVNAENGDAVATLPIGPGVDGIGYDADRNLIYSANGGADGTLTIISQSATDSYAVVQTVPTRQRARTLTINPENGQVYLVTDLLGVDLSQTSNSRPVETNPVNGTFQVLVVGN